MFFPKARLWLLLALELACVVNAAKETCSDSWLYVDIHYRAVDAKLDTYSYGLFIGAGTNSQNQSIWPSITSNETRMASHDLCGQASSDHCDDPMYTHGHFGADASSTWMETPDYVTLDAAAPDAGINLTYGQDILNLFSHYTDPSPASKYVVANHPIAIMSDVTSSQDIFFNSGSLGLGSTSTLAKQLIEEGRINRNVFGMYLGTAYPRAGGIQNGSIVLGGYDAGRMEGEVHKYGQVPVPAPGISPFKVNITQMSLVTEDGSSIPLITDEGFSGYIASNQYAMELPRTVTQRLSDGLKALPQRSPDTTLQLAQRFNGNLTITLDDGFQITYPSEWISNTSNITPFSASILDSDNSSSSSAPLVLGASFLHHLYMTVDYEDSSFYLANTKFDNSYVQPQSLCVAAAPIPIGAPNIGKFVQTGMIGAVLGGLIGGAGLSWLVIFWLRKRLQANRTNKAIRRMESGAVPMPKKSSLRTKTKDGFLKLGKKSNDNKEARGVSFIESKRVSFSDSETSSLKGVTVTITKADEPGKSPIELSMLKHDRLYTHSEAPGLSSISPAASVIEPVKTTETSAGQEPLPTPKRFENPYAASPAPYTPYDVATPRTGNPLLGDFRQQYTNYDDNDNSDLPHSQQPGLSNHNRTTSDQLRKKLNLRVQTSTPSSRQNSSDIISLSARSRMPRPRAKPVPLPLKIVTNAGGRDGNVAGSPASLRSEMSFSGPGGKKRHNLLRKVFPSY